MCVYMVFSTSWDTLTHTNNLQFPLFPNCAESSIANEGRQQKKNLWLCSLAQRCCISAGFRSDNYHLFFAHSMPSCILSPACNSFKWVAENVFYALRKTFSVSNSVSLNIINYIIICKFTICFPLLVADARSYTTTQRHKSWYQCIILQWKGSQDQYNFAYAKGLSVWDFWHGCHRLLDDFPRYQKLVVVLVFVVVASLLSRSLVVFSVSSRLSKSHITTSSMINVWWICRIGKMAANHWLV